MPDGARWHCRGRFIAGTLTDHDPDRRNRDRDRLLTPQVRGRRSGLDCHSMTLKFPASADLKKRRETTLEMALMADGGVLAGDVWPLETDERC
jgi:hypothetical protein